MRLCSWTQAASSQWALGQIWQREKKKDVCVKGGVRDVVFTPKSKHKIFFRQLNLDDSHPILKIPRSVIQWKTPYCL